ncbi:MAG: hypothetical protein FJY88_14300 [Candidatus Eisenbacteria bacterium]|nr:hypothetical protein [Candidatus Eisenbacteria bacterium]
MNAILRSTALKWILAVAVAMGSAVFQRVTGPTYPVRVRLSWAGEDVRARLTRTHSGPGDQTIAVRAAGSEAAGDLLWRRYPTRDDFTRTPMQREGDLLVGRLPHQPPAGKLEYWVELQKGTDRLRLPASGSVVTRFKGAVPLPVLILHVVVIFAAMIWSNRAGLEGIAAVTGGSAAARGSPKRRASLARLTWIAFGLLVLGGMILGPVIQKYAFGAFWTGVPFGWDLTDNKTLISFLAWLAAAISILRSTRPHRWVIAAAIVTLIIFLIPHSLLGSELKYE